MGDVAHVIDHRPLEIPGYLNQNVFGRFNPAFSYPGLGEFLSRTFSDPGKG